MHDCIVVGGGLIGMLSARLLAERGLEVMLLERGEIGRESSWAGGGILSPLYPWRYPEPVNLLAGWSQPRYPALCAALAEETGIDPEWTQSGLLMLAPEDAREGRAWAEAHGVDLQTLPSEAVGRVEPALDQPPEGLWMPQIAQLRNPRMLRALRRSLELRGVTLREGCEVREVLVENGRVSGVAGDFGRLRAGRVLIAGGAWSAALFPLHGRPLPVEPVRGQMLLYRAEPGLLSRIVLAEGRYLIPRRDGHVLVGSTVEHVGFDKSVTEAARIELQEIAERLVPALSRFAIVHHWAGLRPGIPDGIPVVDEHPEIKGLFINAGHYRNGVVTGYAACAVISARISGDDPPLNDKDYQLRKRLKSS